MTIADTPVDADPHAETIVAIATPPGVGAVGIVRLSGPRAFAIGRALFRPVSRGAGASASAKANRHASGAGNVADGSDDGSDDVTPPSHLLTYGRIVDPASGELVDEALVAFMRAPHTYTREDVVEINAHGGPTLLRRIVGLALAAGARAAQPGEFTLRAFLHGRVDLAQAEAVMALINAESDAAQRLALRQLQGELSARVQAARDAALGALTRIEASIDFPDEEVPPPDPAELAALVAQARGEVARLLAGADRGRILREGLRVAIVGRPNVGKSSLLNALLGVERAIVTPVAGTTRDTVEESAQIGGVALHLVDTAGLTPTTDPVERLGVERSRAAAREADLLIFALDGSIPLTELDYQATGELRDLTPDPFPQVWEGAKGRFVALSDESPATPPSAPTARETPLPTGVGRGRGLGPLILALNKADLPAVVSVAEAQALWPRAQVVATSTLTRDGMAALEAAIGELALGGVAQPSDALVSAARQRNALRRADEQLAAAETTLADHLPLDFVSVDLRAALEALGEITGETATGDLLDRIFAEFCIGK